MIARREAMREPVPVMRHSGKIMQTFLDDHVNSIY
jgi:hypothetical protein